MPPRRGTVPWRTSSSRVNGRCRKVRRDRYGPSVATGGSTACSRVPSGSRPSTYGDPSSSRRPQPAASRWASRRTSSGPPSVTAAGCSPRPRSTQTRTPLTSTSVTSASASSGASGPTPTRSSCTWVAIRSTVVSPSTAAPGSARTAVTTAAGVTVVPSVANRCRTRLASSASPRPADAGLPSGPRTLARPVMPTPADGIASSSVSRRWQSRASGPRPVEAGASPRSRPRLSPGSGRSVPASGRLSARATSRAFSRPGAGPRTITDRFGAVQVGGGDHPGRRRGRPQLGRHHDERLVGRLQRDHRRVVELTRQVHDDQVAAAPAGVHGGRHRLGRQGEQVTPVPGEHHQVAPAGQGPDQRRCVDPAVGPGQRRPAQPFQLLPAEHQVQTTAERVGVDQQGPQPAPGGGDGQPAGQHARAGAAPAADHRQHPAESGAGRSGYALGESVHQPGLGRGQHRHVFGADQLGQLPAGVAGSGSADQHHPGATRQPRPQAGLGLVGADHDQWRGGPAGAGRGRVGDHLDLGAAGRGESEQFVEKVTVGGQDQRQARSGMDGSTGWHHGLQRRRR